MALEMFQKLQTVPRASRLWVWATLLRPSELYHRIKRSKPEGFYGNNMKIVRIFRKSSKKPTMHILVVEFPAVM